MFHYNYKKNPQNQPGKTQLHNLEFTDKLRTVKCLRPPDYFRTTMKFQSLQKCSFYV